jgi:D-alanyl-D-alanine carboxypeptidase (penicillin-binding protein 5/6)
MSTLSPAPHPSRPATPAYGPVTHHRRNRRRRRRPRVRRTLLLGLVVAVAVAAIGAVVLRDRLDDSRRHYIGADGWPATGQAAFALDHDTEASPGQRPVPIASLAKVMTAYVVLRQLPLPDDASAGPRYTVTQDDVDDTARRRDRDESVVAVEVGEVLSERQALMAILLPSANNVAILLARHVAGSVRKFVARMNTAAAALGLHRTHYTDPSGFDEGTVSTAADQVVLARAVAKDQTLSTMVATPSYSLPVAGTVHNTDSLLGQDGFVGTKTGSDDAAGGCFMFRTYRVVDGTVTELTGVVLGQRGHNLISAGLQAARQLAHRVAPVVAHA